MVVAYNSFKEFLVVFRRFFSTIGGGLAAEDDGVNSRGRKCEIVLARTRVQRGEPRVRFPWQRKYRKICQIVPKDPIFDSELLLPTYVTAERQYPWRTANPNANK